MSKNISSVLKLSKLCSNSSELRAGSDQETQRYAFRIKSYNPLPSLKHVTHDVESQLKKNSVCCQLKTWLNSSSLSQRHQEARKIH